MFAKVLRRSTKQASHCGGHLCMAAWDGVASSKGWSSTRWTEVLPASSVMGGMGFCWRGSALSHPVLPAPGVLSMARVVPALEPVQLGCSGRPDGAQPS